MSKLTSPLYAETLKQQAKDLRHEMAARGIILSHGQALEQIAQASGFRDWNTASAILSAQMICPVSLGQRVSGFYLKQPFQGTVLATQTLSGGNLFRIIVHFDEPVDVVSFDSFSCLRQRVVCQVDAKGVSPNRTGDGHAHMVFSMRTRHSSDLISA